MFSFVGKETVKEHVFEQFNKLTVLNLFIN